MRARQVGAAEPDPGQVAFQGEAEALERGREQQVLLVAVAAAPARHHLVLKAAEVEADAPAEEHVQVLERDGLDVRQVHSA